jgi:DNA-binding CsgD family transcriptional regulator
LFQTGRLADAGAALEARFESAAGEPVVGALYAAGAVALGRVAIHTGDERRKRLAVSLAEGMLADGTPANRKHGAWLLALIAMAEGRVPAARAALDAVAGEPGGLLPHYPLDVTDEIELVRIALAADDRQTAVEAVTIAESRARANPHVSTIQAAAAHARGLLDGDCAALDAAAQRLASGPRPLVLASALEDLGVAQARGGETHLGIETLGRALITYTDGGAAWDAARVRSRLRAHGVRRRLVADSRPESGWHALTDSELTVVRLIAQGLTNREAAEQLFVSPHTVNSHLRHAFTKLGVNSRRELARMVSAQSAAAPLD